MKKRKLMISILAGILVAALILGLVGMLAPVMTVPAQAQTSSSIKSEINDLEAKKKEAEEKRNSLQLQVDEHMSEVQQLMAEKDLIDQEITLIYEQMDAINQQITAYSSLIADKQEELDIAEENLAQLQALNKERIRAMEKNGKLSYWAVIFRANNFVDLLDRLKMVQEIAEADQARIQQLSDAAQEVADTKASLESEKAEMESVKEELKAAEAEVAVKLAEVEEVLAELIATGEEYAALLEEADAGVAEIEDMILDKQEEYDEAKEREYQEWLAQNPPAGNAGSSNTVGGITWLVPVNYTAFTSAYGPRNTGIPGASTWHHGVDLAAPTGTPIYATRSGVVTLRGVYGTGGNTIRINHQDGYTSIYMHMSRYADVYVGQYVYAGQIIGYVGSTGVSSGPHLHFGIYLNGSSVNPAYYINI